MNKQDLIGAVAMRLGAARARAAEVTELFFAPDGVIAPELKRGGKMAIRGFGNFEIRERAAREGRPPGPARRSPSRPRGCPRSAPAGP